MTLMLDKDTTFSATAAGISKVAELIATVPAEDRSRALKAAEKLPRNRSRGLSGRRGATVGFGSDVAVAQRGR